MLRAPCSPLLCSRGSTESNSVHPGNAWRWHAEPHRQWKGKRARCHGTAYVWLTCEPGTNLYQESGEICKDTTPSAISQRNRNSAWSAGEAVDVWSNVPHWGRGCAGSPVFRAISRSRWRGRHASLLSSYPLTCCLLAHTFRDGWLFIRVAQHHRGDEGDDHWRGQNVQSEEAQLEAGHERIATSKQVRWDHHDMLYRNSRYWGIHSITTPTSKRPRYNSHINEMGYADQLITSPVDVDPNLERDLSGIL